ncbi:MAG: sodium:calcium antiporter [Alphaproteobacteria bacterium CG_4_10_14_0_8_um_filter_53_9]|nr:MAG: sodium:calcium antiporter [Alphaproteobacteria bacterium CG_4_10_14_0_8_um_filter_53_9]
MTWLTLAGGLVFLGAGAESLVRGSVGLGKHCGLSPLIMGLTLVAFGTSSPELVASLQAAFRGVDGVAIGNVVGSNIMNIWLILGVVALMGGLSIQRATLLRDGGYVVLATLGLTTLMFMFGEITRLSGLIMFMFLVAYLIWVYRISLKEPLVVTSEIASTPAMPVWLGLVFVVLGLVGLILGAKLLVDAAVFMAASWGVSDAVIGLTVVAVGTSLPELAASAAAAMKKEADMALGSILGSNLFNILAILGITSMVMPLSIPEQIIQFDGFVMMAAVVSLFIWGGLQGRLGRFEGALYLAFLAVYIWALIPTTL